MVDPVPQWHFMGIKELIHVDSYKGARFFGRGVCVQGLSLIKGSRVNIGISKEFPQFVAF